MVSAISGGSYDVVQMWQALLKKADTNGDGAIAKTEMQSILDKNSSSADDIVGILDTNQDGSVSETEFEDTMSELFVQLLQSPPPPMMGQTPEDIFNTIDQNGDGSIDKTEMESVAQKAGLSVDDIFSKMDTDADGVIGKSEFEDALSKMRGQPPQGPPPQAMMGQSPEDIFKTIDENGDGSITKDELSSFMAQNNLDVDSIFKEADTNNDEIIGRSESDAHLEKMKAEKQAQDAPELAAADVSNEKGWESMMLQMLLKAYTATSDGSAESKSVYA